MIDTLVHAPNSATGEFELGGAARTAGLTVHRIAADAERGVDVAQLVRRADEHAAYRCAGGPLAAAIGWGAPIRLLGATPEWFAELPVEVTGRRWSLVDVPGARAGLDRGPSFVKLAAAKFRPIPAKRYRTVAEFDAALAAVNAPPELALLATPDWLDIDSEYRVFTIGREVVACSPYLVQDDPWTPLLRTHRASFHDAAAQFAVDLLAALPPDDVPPTAVVDVARLSDRRFVVLETNHVWSSGLYGCDPAAVLLAVVAAADASSPDGKWRWRPDAAVLALHRRS